MAQDKTDETDKTPAATLATTATRAGHVGDGNMPPATAADKNRAARQFAGDAVKRFLQSEPSLPDFGFCFVSYFLWWRFNLTFVEGSNSSYVELEDSAAYALCETALEHAGVRRLVQRIIASRIENGMPFSPELRRFACLALLGLLPKPRTSRGPKISQRFERDLFIIWTLTEMQTEFGISPTENDARAPTSTREPSGMNILAQCFRESGRHEITARAIKEVWLDTRKRGWADRIEKAINEYQPLSRNALRRFNAATSRDGNSR